MKVRLTKSKTENIQVPKKKVQNQRGKGNVDKVFLEKIIKLVKIVIPSLYSKEILDVVLLTYFKIIYYFFLEYF